MNQEKYVLPKFLYKMVIPITKSSPKRTMKSTKRLSLFWSNVLQMYGIGMIIHGYFINKHQDTILTIYCWQVGEEVHR